MTAKKDLPPYRPCDLCGGVDQDPRHSFSGLIGAPDNVVFEVDEAAGAEVQKNLELLTGNGSVTFAEAMAIGAAFKDTTTTDRHYDCCNEAGCPTGTCGPVVEAAKGKTGEGMRKAALSMSKGK